jgi:hypothetical protein
MNEIVTLLEIVGMGSIGLLIVIVVFMLSELFK